MSKLTDILEAIPLCEAYMDGVDDGCNTCPYNGRCKDLVPDTIKMLEDLAKRVPCWISVEERLPEYNEYVLCWYTDSDGLKWHTIGRFCEWNHLWDLDIAYDHDEKKIVTHWMPLPEPPEEDDHATG